MTFVPLVWRWDTLQSGRPGDPRSQAVFRGRSGNTLSVNEASAEINGDLMSAGREKLFHRFFEMTRSFGWLEIRKA